MNTYVSKQYSQGKKIVKYYIDSIIDTEQREIKQKKIAEKKQRMNPKN